MIDVFIARNAAFLDVAGRILLVILFAHSGYSAALAYEPTAGWVTSKGFPGSMLWLAIGIDLIGATAILFGYKTRMFALLLAGYTLFTGFGFHSNISEISNLHHLLKNLAIAGGFLVLAANGAGAWSIDARRQRQSLPDRL